MTRALPSRLCACGCGQAIEKESSRILYDPPRCRPKWRKRQVEQGEMLPTSWGTCLACGEQFPQYKTRPFTLRKQYCARACVSLARSEAAAANKSTACPGWDTEENHLGKLERARRRQLAKNRRHTCFQGTNSTPCSKYMNWLTDPEFFCECTGYEAGVPENIMTGE